MMRTGAMILWMALAALSGVARGAGTPSPGTDRADRDGVFIHVTSGSENPHRVAMALKMAALMSGSGDCDVLMYFDIEGVRLLVKDAPDVSHKGFEGSKRQIAALLGRGVPILACPSRLEAGGHVEADLVQGVKLADKKLFFGFTRGRILTLDY